jgi:hypothetical protein
MGKRVSVHAHPTVAPDEQHALTPTLRRCCNRRGGAQVETAGLAWGALVLSPGGGPRPAVRGPSDDPLVDWRLRFGGSV